MRAISAAIFSDQSSPANSDPDIARHSLYSHCSPSYSNQNFSLVPKGSSPTTIAGVTAMIGYSMAMTQCRTRCWAGSMISDCDRPCSQIPDNCDYISSTPHFFEYRQIQECGQAWGSRQAPVSPVHRHLPRRHLRLPRPTAEHLVQINPVRQSRQPHADQVLLR